MTAPATAGIQVDEDPRFERRSWVVRRIGSAVGAAIILGGLVGVFGTGPVAHVSRTGAGGVQIDYDRFVRTTASTTIRVSVPDVTRMARVALSRDYLDHADVSGVQPLPKRVLDLPDRRVYVISQRGSAQIDFDVTPLTVGTRHLTVWVSGSGHMRLTQLVWP